MTPEELAEIKARTAKVPTWACNSQRSHAPQMRADLDLLIAEVDRLLAEVRQPSPAPKVATWGDGGVFYPEALALRGNDNRTIGRYECTNLGDARTPWVAWIGAKLTRFRTAPEARAHIEAWARGKGWEVRDGE